MKATTNTVAAAVVAVIGAAAMGCNTGGGGGSRRTASTGAAVGSTVLSGNLVEARWQHQATAIDSGTKVLITGGTNLRGVATNTAELWEAGRSAPLPEAMTTARAGHRAVVLASGEVWILGGHDATGRALKTTELWSPSERSFRAGPELLRARDGAAIFAAENVIVVAGGEGEGSIELWAPDLSGSALGAEAPGLAGRGGALGFDPDGRGFLVGGTTDQGAARRPVAIDLDGGSARPVQGERFVEGGALVTATLDGSTFEGYVVGGSFNGKPFTALQRLRSGEEEVVQVLPRVLQSRERGVAIALGRGILIAGGLFRGLPTASVEVVQASGSSEAPSLKEPRTDLEATLLRDGSVLFTGGLAGDGRPVGLTELLVPPGASAPDAAAAFARVRAEKAEQERLVAERDAALATAERLGLELEATTAKLEAERAKREAVEAELAAAKARIATLEAEAAGLRDQIAQLQGQVAQLAGQVTQLQAQLAQLQGEKDQVDAALATERANLGAAVAQADRLTTEAIRFQQQRDATAAQLQAEKARADQLQAELTAARTPPPPPPAATPTFRIGGVSFGTTMGLRFR